MNLFLSPFLSTCLSSFFLPNDFQLSLELKLYLYLEFDLDLQLEYQMCAKYTPQSNDLVLIACNTSRLYQNQT